MFKPLLTWSKEECHRLPWRTNRSLYSTLVSEIMLQQTTVGTVLKHYQNFMKRYPTITALANATEEEICISWKGLGYYRRARNLLHAAKKICSIFDGQIPLEYEQLILIPGIGEYTANALLAIGGDQKALALDANLERVLSRLYLITGEKGPKLQKKIQLLFKNKKILNQIDKKISYRELNEALMDLGRVYCQANRAECVLCPMNFECAAFKQGVVLDFPNKKKSAIRNKLLSLDLLRIIVTKDKHVMVFKKNPNEWLSGQFEIPTYIVQSEDESLVQYPRSKKISRVPDLKDLPSFNTSITKYKIKNYILQVSESEFRKEFVVEGEVCDKYSFILLDKEKQNFSTSTLKTFKKINL